MDIAPYIRTAKSVITANSPVLLLGTTIAGVVTTGVLAAKAGYSARGIIDEAESRYKDEHDEEFAILSTQDKIQFTWQCFTLPLISGAGTIAAAVGTHTIHTKRANAMAAIYAVTSNKLDDMGDRAQELLGPKKAQQLRDEVAQRQIDRDPVEDKEIYMLTDGSELCYDEWTGRYFMSSIPQIENAVNEINRLLLSDDDVSLNEFYDRVGLPNIQMANSFGWSGGKMDVTFGATNTKDGRSAISVGFREAPKENMGLYR